MNIDLLKRKAAGKNWSHRQIAEICCVSIHTVHKWFQGRRKPNGEHLYKLSDALCVSASDLWGEHDGHTGNRGTD